MIEDVQCCECFATVKIDTERFGQQPCSECTEPIRCHQCGRAEPEFDWLIAPGVYIGGVWCSAECVGLAAL